MTSPSLVLEPVEFLFSCSTPDFFLNVWGSFWNYEEFWEYNDVKSGSSLTMGSQYST